MINKSQCQTHTRNPWGKPGHRYDYRIRYLFMGILFVAFLAVVIVAIVIVVEVANNRWMNTDIGAEPNLASANPLVLKAVRGDDDDEKAAPYHPPFSFCGDQLHDCQAYFKPNLCCPPLKVCHETEWSPSGIYCCGMSDECIVSEEQPATCVANTTQCGRELGGGCCPEGTTCSPDGCLQILGINLEFDDKLLSLPSTMETDRQPAEDVSTRHIGNYGMDVAMRTADAAKAIHTGIKFGEVGLVKSSACDTLITPHYLYMILLGAVAAFLSWTA
ncbi:hypothetical protein ACJ41O_013935 [Fusarium nematophilum]